MNVKMKERDVLNDQYMFSCDWLNVVLPVTDISKVFDDFEQLCPLLSVERWQIASPKYNYAMRYCLNGQNFIQLMYNRDMSREDGIYALEREDGGNNYGMFISISGDGLRYLDSLRYHHSDRSVLDLLLTYFYLNEARCSRIDIALDIFDADNKGVPELKQAFYYFQKPRVGFPTLCTNFHRTRDNIKRIPLIDNNGDQFWNFQLGSHGSKGGMFRCYNKLIETMDSKDEDISKEIFQELGVTDYWYRMEIELHGAKAAECFDACFCSFHQYEPFEFSLGALWFAALNSMFRVVQNISVGYSFGQMPNTDGWQSFCDLISSIIHFVQFSFTAVPFVPTNRKKLENHCRQIAPYLFLISLYLERCPDLRDYIMSEGQAKFWSNPRYNGIRDELFVPDSSSLSIENFCV